MYVDLLVSTGHTLITCHALVTSVGNRPFELSDFFLNQRLRSRLSPRVAAVFVFVTGCFPPWPSARCGTWRKGEADGKPCSPCWGAEIAALGRLLWTAEVVDDLVHPTAVPWEAAVFHSSETWNSHRKLLYSDAWGILGHRCLAALAGLAGWLAGLLACLLARLLRKASQPGSSTRSAPTSATLRATRLWASSWSRPQPCPRTLAHTPSNHWLWTR